MGSRGKEGNPLAHVLQAIGEELELVQYNTWNVILPEGQFLTKARVFGAGGGGRCTAEGRPSLRCRRCCCRCRCCQLHA
jgi:hypothetical protein